MDEDQTMMESFSGDDQASAAANTSEESAKSASSSVSGSATASASASAPANPKSYKTALCQFYLAGKGPCKNGNECSFAHGTSELRSSASGRSVSDSTASAASKAKTKLCERFLQFGACAFGAQCSYAHGVRELQQSIVKAEKSAGQRQEDNPTYKTQLCKNYMEGFFCQYADKCGYAHGKHELRTKPILKPEDMTPENKAKLMAKARARPDYKTKVCTNYEASRECQYGELCVFAHGSEELRAPTTATDDPSYQQNNGGRYLEAGAAAAGAGGGAQMVVPAQQAASPHYKTALCKYANKCTFGTKCTFAHSSAELRPPAAAGASGMVIDHSIHSMSTSHAPRNAKTALCKNYMTGSCPYGDKCTFAHGHQELRQQPQLQPQAPAAHAHPPPAAAYHNYKTVLCNAWRQNGYCEDGLECTFAHGTNDLRPAGGNLHAPPHPVHAAAPAVHHAHHPQQQQPYYHGGDPAATNPKYKTSLCQSFDTTGRCEREATCAFAHGVQELRNFATFKTALCKNVKGGMKCERGRNCAFAHSVEELRKPGGAPPMSMGVGMGVGMHVPNNNGIKRKQSMLKTSLCQHFLNKGQCQYGDSCNFAHGEAELQINKKAKY